MHVPLFFIFCFLKCQIPDICYCKKIPAFQEKNQMLNLGPKKLPIYAAPIKLSNPGMPQEDSFLHINLFNPDFPPAVKFWIRHTFLFYKRL